MNFSSNFNGVSGIYKILNINTDKFYIGSAVNLKYRYARHKHHLLKGNHPARYLQSSVDKYGIDSVIFIVLEVCEVKDLIIREQYYLDLLKPFVPDGYNSRKIAKSNKGIKMNPKSIAKAVETKRKKGIIPFKNYDRSLISGEKHPNFGKKWSQETKNKIGAKSKGRKHTAATKLIISQTSKDRKHTEQSKAKIALALKGNKNGSRKKNSRGEDSKLMFPLAVE